MFIFDPSELGYAFNDEHPFDQKRLELTVDLLTRAGALPSSAIIPPRIATEEEIQLVHLETYIDAVKGLSDPEPGEFWLAQADKWGLQTEDTPFFEGMHDVTAKIVGGSLEAAEFIMSGKAEHAVHLGGGLHHAMRHKGAGFCVYNDASVTISYLREKFHARVLYVDTDVHHGDGVQWAFYDDPDVMTVSIHETGKYLFPGTGAVEERGVGQGFGTNINIPVEPFTEDDSWLDSFHDVLVRAVASFKPDIIVSQHGCDAHAYDPQAHVHCSMRIYREMPKLIHELAHQHCGGKWLALGGGGYDIWRVVPRAWSLLWMTMIDHPLLERLDQDPLAPLPADWLAAWQPISPVLIPGTWMDPVGEWEPIPRRREINEKNKRTKEIALLYLPETDSAS